MRELAAKPYAVLSRLTFVFFDSNPLTEAVLDTDTIGNDHYGALLHDPFRVAA
jgi:hypothetical protein